MAAGDIKPCSYCNGSGCSECNQTGTETMCKHGGPRDQCTLCNGGRDRPNSSEPIGTERLDRWVQDLNRRMA